VTSLTKKQRQKQNRSSVKKIYQPYDELFAVGQKNRFSVCKEIKASDNHLG